MNDNTTEPRNLAVRPSAHDTEAAAPGDAGEVPELARHADPSQTAKKSTEPASRTADAAARHGREVVWVRPSELASQMTAKAAGRGIDLHAELARRARRPVVQAIATTRRPISDRARRLPPVTAFGRHGHTPAGATRAGIGLR